MISILSACCLPPELSEDTCCITGCLTATASRQQSTLNTVLVTLHSAHLGNNILFTVCQLNHESFLSGRKWVMLKVYVVPFIKVLFCNHFSSFSIVLQSILSYFQRRVVHSTETETFIMLCFLLPSTWGISWLFP